MRNSTKQTFFGVFTALALAACGGSGGGSDDSGDENGYLRITTPTTAGSYRAEMPFPDILVGGTINRPPPPSSDGSSGGGSIGGGSGNSLACLIIWPCAILTSIFFKGGDQGGDQASDMATEFVSSGNANIASGGVTVTVTNETIEASGQHSPTTSETWESITPVTLGENVIRVDAVDEFGYTSSDRIVVEISAPRYKLPTRNIYPRAFEAPQYFKSPDKLEIHSNSNGDGIIAWNDGSPGHSEYIHLVAAIYHPGSGWSGAQVITDSPVSYRVHPRVSIDDAGNAMVVWCQDGSIRYRRYTPASGWTATVQLFDADVGTGLGYVLSLLTDRQGNAYLFWHDHDKNFIEQSYARYDAVNGWSAPVPHTESLYSHLSADYTIDADGRVSAIWAYNHKIYVAGLSGENGWDTPEQIGSFDSELVDLQVEVSDAGHLAAIWTNRSDDNNDDYRMSANVFHPDSGWRGETAIASGSLDSGFELSAGIDAEGRILAVWPEYADDYDTVMAIGFTQGDGWSSAYPISRSQSGDARGPKMVMQESGRALAVWAQFDGWIESIVALEYDPTGGWQQTELIELNMAAGSRNPVIGSGGENGIFVAWEQYNDVWYYDPRTNSVQVGVYPL